MMIADLIDQDDFRDRLRALGFNVTAEASADEASRQALTALTPERANVLRQLIQELLSGSAALLPAVRQAIDQQLLPALAQAR
ncbi:hypothetical protein [Pseudomonas oryzihabitans]|uniref:Uncharacterized protein n=1 Tax=Pseudomonas oryzihabitans TaxID=47885 RepID=A0AAJ2BWV2_9PSED|nr:hypothetical protein [Pseudomonas psychrotolerans]MDR6234308.1 hypothetical protein [Pseudomonas psychrotolerans]MDR6356573.1 hypothetical protein [Pseudomonas psychrotolerans]MDR6676722.1 hypothetical protein [Pseudomonas psychrotolerans]QDD90405.1 hypothetical protein CCZ28_15820 [Pseudomonas psychrotolerans]